MISSQHQHKNTPRDTVKSIAKSVAKDIIDLKGQITLKDIEKKVRKARSKVPQQYRTLFDDALVSELSDFLRSYFA